MQVIVGRLMTSGHVEASPDMIKITNSYTQTVNGEIYCHFDFTYQTKTGNSLWEIILVRRGDQIQIITMIAKGAVRPFCQMKVKASEKPTMSKMSRTMGFTPDRTSLPPELLIFCCEPRKIRKPAEEM